MLEIGGTYYRPKFRGTGFNRRVKDMMLKRAFDCGIRRVEFRVDRRNGRSQAAMKKLGAVREGVLRADRITWTGHVRDTVLFAILKDEWPVYRPRAFAGLQRAAMAKLYFYYAAMNAGKSTTLLQADFNYRERGMETMLWTAKLDRARRRRSHRLADRSISAGA